MSTYIKGIRTSMGDTLIDYTALANLPESDNTLTFAGQFADAKKAGDEIARLESLIITLKNDLNTESSERESEIARVESLMNTNVNNSMIPCLLTIESGNNVESVIVNKTYTMSNQELGSVQHGSPVFVGDILDIVATATDGYGIEPYATPIIVRDDVNIEIAARKTYTITYNINGYGEQPDALENAIMIPKHLPILSDPDYRFKGWFLDKALTKEATPKSFISSDVTLYAKWTVKRIYDDTLWGISGARYGEDDRIQSGWLVDNGSVWRKRADGTIYTYYFDGREVDGGSDPKSNYFCSTLLEIPSNCSQIFVANRIDVGSDTGKISVVPYFYNSDKLFMKIGSASFDYTDDTMPTYNGTSGNIVDVPKDAKYMTFGGGNVFLGRKDTYYIVPILEVEE